MIKITIIALIAATVMGCVLMVLLKINEHQRNREQLRQRLMDITK